MSYLYIISCKNQKPVKLGLSKNPLKRLKQLQTGSPNIYRIYYQEEIDDSCVFKAEKAIHAILGHKRLKGEWFDISVEDAIAEVKFSVISNDYSKLY